MQNKHLGLLVGRVFSGVEFIRGHRFNSSEFIYGGLLDSGCLVIKHTMKVHSQKWHLIIAVVERIWYSVNQFEKFCSKIILFFLTIH